MLSAKFSSALLDKLTKVSAASLHEAAGRIGDLPPTIVPLWPETSLSGVALPVLSPGGDNLWIHHAIEVAQPGDVLIVATGGVAGHGYWGEVMARAAQAKGVAGLIIEGGVRDSVAMRQIGFPVFSIGRCIRGTAKDSLGKGNVGSPISVGGVRIERGDLIRGDADGVMVLSQGSAEQTITDAERRDDEEIDIFRRLAAGETTMDIYGLPKLKATAA